MHFFLSWAFIIFFFCLSELDDLILDVSSYEFLKTTETNMQIKKMSQKMSKNLLPVA